MASLAGKDVLLYFKHETYTNDEWLVAVCAIQHTLSEQKAESTTITKCGSETVAGTDDNSISFDLTFLKGQPAAGEVSAKILRTMYRAGVEFEWRSADAYPSAQDIDEQGLAVMTACETSFPAEGLVNVSLTLKVNGTITSNI